MGFLYFDEYYLILVLPMLLLSIFAQIRVKTAYSSYSKKLNKRGVTGAAAAAAVLDYYKIDNVRIEKVAGSLSDHFDPRTNVIRLSEGVYDRCTVAAVGIACHEAGHAAQHFESYFPIRFRNAILPVCNIGSTLGVPLAIIGYFINSEPLISVGLLLYALVAVFQLVTLPVEFNASKRAIAVIDETGLLEKDENKGAKSVLRAAAMTYVAALAVSLANLLRLILLTSRRRR